jgi:hypothetical protein
VICDVPCSGDGTLRKNADKWQRWHVGMGLGHHAQQLRILLRGLGGGCCLYCYSYHVHELTYAESSYRLIGSLPLIVASCAYKKGMKLTYSTCSLSPVTV